MRTVHELTISEDLVVKLKQNDRPTVMSLIRGMRSFNEEKEVVNRFTVDWKNDSFHLSFADGRTLKLTPDDLLRTRWIKRIWSMATSKVPQTAKFSTSSFDFSA